MAFDPRRVDPRLYPLPPWPTPPDVIGRRRISPPVPVSSDEGRQGQAPPVIQPPWIYPPFLHFPVDLPQNRIPTAVAAGSSIIVAWPQIPQGATGVCRRVGISTSAAADTRVTTLINRSPVPPLGGVIGAIGTLENPTELAGPVIIRAGEEFALLIENVGAVAVNLAGRTLGWWWGSGT